MPDGSGLAASRGRASTRRDSPSQGSGSPKAHETFGLDFPVPLNSPCTWAPPFGLPSPRQEEDEVNRTLRQEIFKDPGCLQEDEEEADEEEDDDGENEDDDEAEEEGLEEHALRPLGGAGLKEAAGDSAKESDEQVKRKVRLFRSSSIQQSLRRVWSVLPRNAKGELETDGYVELNLRLQKCLAKDFHLDNALSSAITDWAEDVPEGAASLGWEEFSMFLFELCSLWCGSCIFLQTYLLFLNTVFLAVTDARGAHTVGLKPLDSVERLPKQFFNLLSLQGLKRARGHKRLSGSSRHESSIESSGSVPEDVWSAENLTPEGERQSLVEVQRQVFQLTNDSRAVFLFRSQDVEPAREYTSLVAVKNATKGLEKVTLPPSMAVETAEALEKAGYAKALPPSPTPPPVPEPQPTTALAKVRQRSAPSRPALPPVSADRAGAPPVGRHFETRRADGRARGLIAAGQATMQHMSETQLATVTPATLVPATAGTAGSSSRSASHRIARALPTLGEPAGDAEGWSELAAIMLRKDTVAKPKAPTTGILDSAADLPGYTLPPRPADIYAHQASPLMRADPNEVVFKTQKWQQSNQLLPEPFERVLKKLPESTRARAEEVTGGPLNNPTEPLWNEMTHRLQAILKKQGRRAERRKKRRLRSKLRGMGGAAPKSKRTAQELREYLDRSAQEQAAGYPSSKGPAEGEFIGKVHERYLLQKDRLETVRFQVKGLNGNAAGFRGLEEATAARDTGTVRPMYVPPPAGY